MNKFKDFISQIPTAVSGTSLGVIGIFGAWAYFTNWNFMNIIGASIASIGILLIFLRFIMFPKSLWEDLHHPILSGVVATSTMATMLIASTLHQFHPTLGAILWTLGITGHCIIFWIFMSRQIKNFAPQRLMSSWFVPGVGFNIAAISGTNIAPQQFLHFAFLFGLSAYLLLLPFVCYRLFFGTLKEEHLPTFGFLAAPANLCLVGYFSLRQSDNFFFATHLAYLGVFSTFIAYLSLIKVLNTLKFSPLFAAYTFPLSIGASAMILYSQFLKITSFHIPRDQIIFWKIISIIELCIASIVIFYVAINLFFHIIKKNKKSP